MPPDAERPRVLSVHEAHKALCDAGVIDPDDVISKIIIEVDIRNGPVVMHIERFGDTRLLMVLPDLARGAEVVNDIVEEPAT